VARRHLSPETAVTRGAKSEEGHSGLLDPLYPDGETSSHEVGGEGSTSRRGRRPLAAGYRFRPGKGADLPWTFGAHGCGVEERCSGECLCARSTEDASPTAISMAKVTIIGATGNVGMFAAHTVSEIPYVSEMLLVGRPGREDFLGGCCHDLSDSFAARGTHVRALVQHPALPMQKTLMSSSAQRGFPGNPARTGTTLLSRTQRSSPRLPKPSAGARRTLFSSWSQTRSTS